MLLQYKSILLVCKYVYKVHKHIYIYETAIIITPISIINYKVNIVAAIGAALKGDVLVATAGSIQCSLFPPCSILGQTFYKRYK